MPGHSDGSECIETLTDSRVKVEQHSRSAVILNLDRAPIRRIQVDGCLVKNKLACDWIVSKANCADVVIELKGRDVNHAVEQIKAGLNFWKDHVQRGKNTKLAALIVCNQYPRIDTKIQLAKQQLARDYAAPLHVWTRNIEYDLCTLAKFAEP